MNKIISSAALIAGVLMVSQVQAASGNIEERLEAIEQKLADGNGANFIKTGKDKISVTLYGQVNKAVMFADDGHKNDVLFVDNDASSTRIGIKAKTKKTGNLVVGAQFEAEYQSNDSNKVSMSDTTPSSGVFSKRQMKVYVQHKQRGKLTIGQGSTATDGVVEKDLSGTTLAGSAHIKISGAGFKFWDKTTTPGAPGAYSSTDVGDVFDHLDGGRKNMVRYDSPELIGLTLSASAAEENYNDIALTYHKKLELLEIKAGVGYAYNGEGQDPGSRMSGSASVLFNFGLDLTLAAGNGEFSDPTPTTSRDDASYTYFKVGYKFKAFPMGSTAISIDYGQFDEFAAENDKGTVYGLQVVQKVKDLNSEFYLGFRNMELERNDAAFATVNLDDIQTSMAGVRFKF